ncbi:helix-turn-helix domain-containing protein, partial [Ligilactobacillus ruminis]
MAKYSPELKAEIISKYNQGMATSIQLAREYNLNSRVVRSWIQTYRLQGKIRHSRNKRIFDTDFKLAVIDYYQTHEVTIAEVAARFDLLPGQVSHWRTL